MKSLPAPLRSSSKSVFLFFPSFLRPTSPPLWPLLSLCCRLLLHRLPLPFVSLFTKLRDLSPSLALASFSSSFLSIEARCAACLRNLLVVFKDVPKKRERERERKILRGQRSKGESLLMPRRDRTLALFPLSPADTQNLTLAFLIKVSRYHPSRPPRRTENLWISVQFFLREKHVSRVVWGMFVSA